MAHVHIFRCSSASLYFSKPFSGLRTKSSAGRAHPGKEPHTPRSDSSADPQCKLRWQPQKATGCRVRVPSHGAVCVTIAKLGPEEHGYSWVTPLTNGTSAHPCVPRRREQGKAVEGPLPGPAGHLGLQSVPDKRFVPCQPGTATVPPAETCHCPGRGRGMLLLFPQLIQ